MVCPWPFSETLRRQLPKGGGLGPPSSTAKTGRHLGFANRRRYGAPPHDGSRPYDPQFGRSLAAGKPTDDLVYACSRGIQNSPGRGSRTEKDVCVAVCSSYGPSRTNTPLRNCPNHNLQDSFRASRRRFGGSTAVEMRRAPSASQRVYSLRAK
jgi:hypothetical protein